MLFLIWFLAILVVCVLWYLLVRGYMINLVGLLYAIAGAAVDIACQLWLDITSIFRRKKYWRPMDPTATDERKIFKA